MRLRDKEEQLQVGGSGAVGARLGSGHIMWTILMRPKCMRRWVRKTSQLSAVCRAEGGGEHSKRCKGHV